jgi:Tryptophan-associated transmembrane protein (Trp_oprn_chp)
MDERHPAESGVHSAARWRVAEANRAVPCALIGLGAAAALVGSFMTWVSGYGPPAEFGPGSFSYDGTKLGGDYVALAAVAVIGCALWLFRHPSRSVLVVTWISVAALVATSVYGWHRASDRVDFLRMYLSGMRGETVSLNVGIWIVLLGAAFATMGIVWATFTGDAKPR